MAAKRRLEAIAAICAAVLILATIVYVFVSFADGGREAKRGVFDLSDWRVDGDGLVQLNGEWEFYPNRLLAPDDFAQLAQEDVSYFAVPDNWRGYSGGHGFTRKGAGTYRLVVKLPEPELDLAVYVENVRMSHRLFVDGRLKGQGGSPSTDPQLFEPGNTPYTAYFRAMTGELELVVQVANYNFFTGGIAKPLRLGSAEQVSTFFGQRIGLDIGVVLVLVLFGAYQVCLYALARRDHMYVLSGAFMLLLGASHSLYNEKISQRLLPEAPFELLYKLMDIFHFLAMVLLLLFLVNVERRLITRRMLHVLLVPFYVYLVCVTVLPYAVHSEFKYVITMFQVFVWIGFFCRMVYVLVRGWDEREGREELLLMCGGGMALLVHFVSSMMYSENLVFANYGTPIGLIGFVACIAILLAQRYSRSFVRTEQLSKQLQRAGELKDELLLNTTHELQTPLHGISNAASFLLQDGEQSFAPQHVRNLWLIKDTSLKLSMLVRDLIDLARLKHDDLPLYPVVVDVRIAVDVVAELLRYELSGKEVLLVNAVDSGIYALADEIRLRQVLHNLIHNAVKFTSVGSIVIRAERRGGAVAVTVEDTGQGIELARHESIFDYLEHGDDGPSGNGHTGIGVGLYIRRQWAERMGGGLAVERSAIGVGTTMALSLPTAEAQREVAASAMSGAGDFVRRPPATGVFDDIVGGHAHTIVIVDDEAANLQVLLNVLARHPYNVLTAFSAKEALGKIQASGKVDLVIADIMMPEHSGIDLCRTLRRQYSIAELPILFATVKDSAHDIALGFQAGANDYITKPFDGETLVARVHTLIAMKSSFQEAVRNELAFHQAQIKPHFLYNALSNVIAFCYTDGEKAAHLLSMLSQYLRYILDMDRTVWHVSLAQELKLIEAYVEIERERFGERIEFRCEVEAGLDMVRIPPLCIQPLVENAMRHGLFEKDGPGIVELTIRSVDGRLEATVSDNGTGIAEDKLARLLDGERTDGGIAIFNIRRRIVAMPGASLHISSPPGGGATVRFVWPIQPEGREFDAVQGDHRRG